MTKATRRYIVACIFYIIAIVLAIIENIPNINFFEIVFGSITYLIYYLLLSKAIEENNFFPIIILACIFFIFLLIFASGGESVIYDSEIHFEIAEILLFIVQIITAIVIKIMDTKK